MNDMNYVDVNSQTVDKWVSEGWVWGKPITHEQYLQALAGQWSLLLTPVKPVPEDWYPPLEGCRVLGLACGGGQQMPILTARGARCTVLDYSPKQLESERQVAQREGYGIEIVRADMSKPLPFDDNSFDLIFHPVSNCYIEDVCALWRECFRVLAPGGVLLAGLDNGINYLVEEDDETHIIRGLPYNPLRDPELYQKSLEKDWGIQFSHSFCEQIGGQLQAGFRLTHVFDDTNGEGELHTLNIPTFWATRAVKPNA